MDIDEFIIQTGLSKQAAAIIKRPSLSHDNFGEMRELFFENSDAFIRKVLYSQKPYESFLWYYCRLALDTYKQYKKRGIPDPVFIDTFKDFAVWNKICVEETGVCGLKEVEWLAAPLKLEIFKLGRLQFRPSELSVDINFPDIKLTNGTRVYEVHIRAGEEFSEDNCLNSYRTAKSFFKDRLICTCDSWMLSPALDELMRPDSNVIKFKNKYKILSVNNNGRSGERYIFGNILDNANDYTADTPYKQRVKTYLLSGGKIGEAYGIFEFC